MRLTTYISLILLLALSSCKSGSKGQDPVDEFAGLTRSSFDIGQVSFSLADIPQLTKVHRDSVGWTQMLPQTLENAPIIYYFPTQERLLSSPHIRVEYIDKKLPRNSSIDDIHGWLKEIFLTEAQGGKVLNDTEVLETEDGQSVKIMEILRPASSISDSVRRGLKIMAWAYIDHNDRFVACNFSATDQDDYDAGIGLFKTLVRSYKDE